MNRRVIGPRFAIFSLLFSLIPLGISLYFSPFFKIKFLPEIYIKIIGILLVAIGLAMFFVSLIAIKRAYRKEKLLITGIFGWCRHPLYSSWVIFTVPGMVLIVNSWLGFTVPIFMYLVLKKLVVQEEQDLEERFGQDYLEYKKRVPPIFPSKAFLKMIHIVSEVLAILESGFLILLLTALVGIAFFQVILRNFFDTSLVWGDTFLRHLVLWLGFIGASLATKDDRHIKIDVLSRILPEQWKVFVACITQIFAAVVCYFLFQASRTFVSFEKEGGSTLFANIPTWIFQLIIVIGFGLIGFRFLLRAAENAIVLFRNGEEKGIAA